MSGKKNKKFIWGLLVLVVLFSMLLAGCYAETYTLKYSVDDTNHLTDIYIETEHSHSSIRVMVDNDNGPYDCESLATKKQWSCQITDDFLVEPGVKYIVDVYYDQIKRGE